MMDRNYWLERESASANLAILASTIEARFAHLEFAKLYRRKSESFEEVEAPSKPLPGAPLKVRLEHPLDFVSPPVERRWSLQELAVLRCLNANGDSIAELASRMRRTQQSVQNRLVAEIPMA